MTAWTGRDVERFADAQIRGDRWQLATFAKWKYRTAGRGVIAVTVRGDPPQTGPALLPLQIGYRPLAQYQQMTAAAPAAMRPHIAYTVDLIQTYDPTTQMVIAVVCGPQFLTVTRLTPLDVPVRLDADDGVH